MQKVPYDIWTQYEAFLKAKVKNVSQHENLKKWFLYFWDFRSKYHPPDSRSEQVSLFIEKLQNKGQSQLQQKQAAHAVSLYFQMHDAETKAATTSTVSHSPADGEGLPQKKVSAPAISPSSPGNHNSFSPPLILRWGGEAGGVTPLSSGSHYSQWRCLEKSGSPAWDKVIDNLVDLVPGTPYLIHLSFCLWAGFSTP